MRSDVAFFLSGAGDCGGLSSLRSPERGAAQEWFSPRSGERSYSAVGWFNGLENYSVGSCGLGGADAAACAKWRIKLRATFSSGARA